MAHFSSNPVADPPLFSCVLKATVGLELAIAFLVSKGNFNDWLKAKAPWDGISNIVMVSGGDYNSIALRWDGTVWKWGLNDVGELGQGTNDNAGIGPAVDLLSHPFPVQVTQDKFGNAFSNVVKVSNRD